MHFLRQIGSPSPSLRCVPRLRRHERRAARAASLPHRHRGRVSSHRRRDKAYHFKLTQILSLDPASRLIQLVTLDAITTALSDPTIIDFDLLERSRRSRGTDRMTDPYQLCKLLDATLNKRSRNLYSQMLSKLR